MADDLTATDYEIRLHKVDGTLSITKAIVAIGTADAAARAAKMLKGDLAYAIVWEGLEEIATVHRDSPTEKPAQKKATPLGRFRLQRST